MYVNKKCEIGNYQQRKKTETKGAIMADIDFYRFLFLLLFNVLLSEEVNQTDVEFCVQCTVNRYRDQTHKE